MPLQCRRAELSDTRLANFGQCRFVWGNGPIACDATVRVCCGAVLFGVCFTVLVQDIVIVGNFSSLRLVYLLDFLSAGPHCHCTL